MAKAKENETTGAVEVENTDPQKHLLTDTDPQAHLLTGVDPQPQLLDGISEPETDSAPDGELETGEGAGTDTA